MKFEISASVNKYTMDCSICQEDIFTGCASCIPCGHVFHTKCLKRWLLTSYSCPVCRKICCSTSLLKLFLNPDNHNYVTSTRRRHSDVPRPMINTTENIPDIIRNIASALRNPNANVRNFQSLRNSGVNLPNTTFQGFLASMQPTRPRHVGVNVAEFIQVAATSSR